MFTSKKVTIVIAAVLSAGCSTVSDVKGHAPEFVIESNKDARTTAVCISDKLYPEYNVYGHTITTRMTTGGYAVVYELQFGSWGKTIGMLLDVMDKPDGKSTSTARFASDLQSSRIAFIKNATTVCSI